MLLGLSTFHPANPQHSNERGKTMKLNIYEKKEVVKTYEADTYDLLFGTVEDVTNALNLDQMKTGSDVEIIKMAMNLVLSSLSTVKDLMKDIFDGLTDEELRNVKVKEMAEVLLEVAKYTLELMDIHIPKSEKN